MDKERSNISGNSGNFDNSINFPHLKRIFTNEQEFRDIIDALPAAIYLTDSEGRLTHYNRAAIEFSGHQPELGTDRWCVTWNLYHPDGRPMPHDTCPMAMALKEGRSIRGNEAIAERPDGERIWFRAYPSPLRNEDGDIVGGINMLIDISEEKKAEKQLRQNERELDDFFENATIGLHWVGADGRIKRVNQAELDLLGYTRDEYIGREIAEFHADKEVIDDILQRLKAGEELHDYEARLRCKDGSVRHVLISSNAYWVDGEFIHTRCFTRDITEKKKAWNSLRENKERLSTKVTDMNRLYALNNRLLTQKDVEAALQEVMKASAALFNADKASVQIYDERENVLRLVDTIGFDRDFTDRFRIIDPDGISTCAAALTSRDRVLLEDCSSTSDFTDFARIATSYGMNSVLSTPLFGGEGQIFGVFSMYWSQPHHPAEDKLQMMDLYAQQAARQIERKQAEEQLHTMNDTLEERVQERTEALLAYQDQLRSLAARLSETEEMGRQQLATELHDNLGQILAIGKMELDLMANDEMPDHILSGIGRVTELMSDAIRHTRELMSDLKPAPSIDKDDLVSNIEWVAQKMAKYGLDVSIKDDGQPKPLEESMRIALCQSVRELLFNVVKHAGVDKADVILSRLDKQVQVTVKDEGKGFSIGDKKAEPTKKGGFGLFNMQERMEWLKSSVKINSSPGEGTEVNLFIPVDPVDNKEHENESDLSKSTVMTTGHISTGTKIKVLIADDHKMMRKGLSRLIEEQDDLMVIAEASNGREAVELTYEYSPDVIIMDINMPEMNGIEATSRIIGDALPVRIIGLSFHEEEDVAQAMLDAGASIYLTKSEVFETLCATVRSEGMMLNGNSDMLSA
ncbi:MAG: PAS domain S-box protein [Balneolaceae bacterium]